MKKLVYLCILISLTLSCHKPLVNKIEVKSQITLEKDIPSVTTHDTFDIWWKYKYNSLPNYQNYEYLKEFSLDTLIKYYRILSIEFFNTKGSGRNSNTTEKLAEKMNIRKEIFEELNNYFGLEYYKYLGNITKEYFKDNDIGITPDYYLPINSTVYIGEHTFNCSITINKCKDDPKFQEEVGSIIIYLKTNLPERIQGFRIFSVKYECDETGTNGSMNIGYMWRRSDDFLLKMNEGIGTYGKQLPEDTLHWHEDSWNDGKNKVNIYEIK